MKAHSARTARGRLAAGIALGALIIAVIVYAFTTPNILAIYIFIAAFYLMIVSKRVRPALKFWLSIIPFYTYIFLSAPYVFSGSLIAAARGQSVIGVYFFNFFLLLPFFILSGVNGFSSAALINTSADFISGQALFCFRHATGIILLVCMGFSYVALNIFSKRIVPVEAPDLEKFRIAPRFLLPAALLLGAFYSLHGDSLPERALAAAGPVVLALYAVQGMALANVFFRRTRHATPLTSLLFISTLLVSGVLWAAAAAGAADSAFGLRNLFSRAVHPVEDRQTLRGLSRGGAFAGCFLIVALVIAGVVFSITGLGGDRIIIFPSAFQKDPNARFTFNDTGSEVRIRGPGAAFAIDKYEYPNVKNALPKNRVAPEEARALCAQNGGRLCTAKEWETGCRAGSFNYNYYLTPDSRVSKVLVANSCARDARQGVVPSGQFDKCRNPYGLYDMMGNLWELVEPPAGTDFVLVMGQGLGSGYEVLNNCGWIQALYKDQYSVLPHENIGFRCCRTLDEDMGNPGIASK